MTRPGSLKAWLAGGQGQCEDLVEHIAERIQEQGSCEGEVAIALARQLVDPTTPLFYDRWRHGGWYVHGVRYPSGAVGCVSRNYVDKRWRVVVDPRRKAIGEDGDFYFGSREEAARAEQFLALEEWYESLDEREVVQERPAG